MIHDDNMSDDFNKQIIYIYYQQKEALKKDVSSHILDNKTLWNWFKLYCLLIVFRCFQVNCKI